MMSPLVFQDLPSGRVVARLGDRLIGEIVPWSGGHRVGAHWRLTLPREDGTSPAPVPKPAASIEKARAALSYAIEEWFDSAGPYFADLVRELRARRDERGVSASS